MRNTILFDRIAGTALLVAQFMSLIMVSQLPVLDGNSMLHLIGKVSLIAIIIAGMATSVSLIMHTTTKVK